MTRQICSCGDTLGAVDPYCPVHFPSQPPTAHVDCHPARAALLTALAAMPDEAFGWFVGWASGSAVQYPDGLGGFMPMSRAAITELRAQANAYVKAS